LLLVTYHSNQVRGRRWKNLHVCDFNEVELQYTVTMPRTGDY
jgi:hypothetical protein